MHIVLMRAKPRLRVNSQLIPNCFGPVNKRKKKKKNPSKKSKQEIEEKYNEEEEYNEEEVNVAPSCNLLNLKSIGVPTIISLFHLRRNYNPSNTITNHLRCYMFSSSYSHHSRQSPPNSQSSSPPSLASSNPHKASTTMHEATPSSFPPSKPRHHHRLPPCCLCSQQTLTPPSIITKHNHCLGTAACAAKFP